MSTLSSGLRVPNPLKRAYALCPDVIDHNSNGFKKMKNTDRSSSSTHSVAATIISASSSSLSSSSSSSTTVPLTKAIILSSSNISTTAPTFIIQDEIQKFAIESFKEPLDRARVQQKVRDLFIKMALEMSHKEKDTVRDAEIALRLEPSSKDKARLLWNLMYIHYKNKKWNGVIASCEQGLKLSGISPYRTASFHFYCGSALMNRNLMSDLEKAKAQFEAGLLVKQGDKELLSNLHFGMSKVFKLMASSKKSS